MRARTFLSIAISFFVVSCAGEGEAPELARARELLDSDQAMQAFRVLRSPAAEDLESVEYLVLLAETCQRLGRIRRGVRSVEKARALAPGHARALYVSALLDIDRERFADADEWIRLAIAADPDAVDYRVLQGELALLTSNYEGAVVAFEAAQRIAPTEPRAIYGLGRALVLSGRQDAGIPHLENYLAERPNHAEAHYLLGLAKFRDGDYETAEAEFRRAIALGPHLPAPYHNLARILQMSGRTEEAADMRARHQIVVERDWAIRTAERALAGNPGDRKAARELIRLLTEAGRTAEAARVRERTEGA